MEENNNNDGQDPSLEEITQPTAPTQQVEVEEKDEWEFKDRTYMLSGGRSPLTETLPSKHSERHPLLYFDEEMMEPREIRYATNQKSCFVDEQKGTATLDHIVFKDGVLIVKKELQPLQKLLSIFHPHKDKLYFEFDPVQIAEYDVEDLDLEVEAMSIAREMDIDHAEAILRTEKGAKVSKMDTKEIRRDVMLLARYNPRLFMSLANDENIELRNTAVKAVEQGIVKLSADRRTFTWASNGAKLLTVPFDEHPYGAMALFFKTDEGMQIHASIEKKLM